MFSSKSSLLSLRTFRYFVIFRIQQRCIRNSRIDDCSSKLISLTTETSCKAQDKKTLWERDCVGSATLPEAQERAYSGSYIIPYITKF